MEKQRKPTQGEIRLLVHKIVEDCKRIAKDYVSNWKPVDAKWPTVEGCAYLRLSTDQQVLVEKGSLEQQIFIAISEAMIRSNNDRINYRILKFFIEPGITGTTDRRPEFNSMMSDIKNRKFKFAIFKELARVARETEIWKRFFNLCIKSECEIFIRGFPFNPNDPTQVLQLDILAAFAAYESNQNSKRVRESNFSAMSTSGKFNSTHKVLGLDQLVVNEVPQVGFYTPNVEGLRTWHWIARTFLKYASFQKTLEECERLGIQNIGDKPFKKHSLHTLLTNKKYIGTWELNGENKAKNQDKLMPYDRYEEVDLPHGCVVERKVWDDVQTTIARIAGNKAKNTSIRRIYPLAGLLKFKDGSSFAGTGAWGKNSRVNYYFNSKNKIRLSADLIENETKHIVSSIIQKSPKIREAVKKWISETQTSTQLLESEMASQEIRLQQLDQDKMKLNRRLDFLLDGADSDKAQGFKEEYHRDLNALKQEAIKIQDVLEDFKQQKEFLQTNSFDYKALDENATQIQNLIQEHDPVALKNAYTKLFETIIVGDIDKLGVRSLEFVLQGDLGTKKPAYEAGVNQTDISSFEIKMAQEEGV